MLSPNCSSLWKVCYDIVHTSFLYDGATCDAAVVLRAWQMVWLFILPTAVLCRYICFAMTVKYIMHISFLMVFKRLKTHKCIEICSQLSFHTWTRHHTITDMRHMRPHLLGQPAQNGHTNYPMEPR